MTASDAMLAELRRIRTAVERAAAPRPKLFTCRDAARELGVGITKFMLMVAEGEVRRVAVGGTRMVPAAELDRLASLPPGKTPAMPRLRQPKAPEATAQEMYERRLAKRRRA